MDKDNTDPTRLLDGWNAAAPSPQPELDLSGLFQNLHGEAAPRREVRHDAERVARLKKRGFDMHDVEDIEVPEITLPPIVPPAPVDTAGLGEALRAASHLAQAQAETTGSALTIDLPPGTAPLAEPRLLTHWQPGAWMAVRRRALGASTAVLNTPDGPLVETLAPQWLMAVWPPQGLDQPWLSRWPERAALVSADDGDTAARRLLAVSVPAQASLWLAELEVDWGLLADLVLHHDAALKPFQIEALRALAEAERIAQFERLNSAYEAARADQPLRLKRP